MAQFPEIQALFESNKLWAEKVKETDPELFPTQSKGQAPKILWIGCADSRVPESVIMARKPGEIFVMRNVANQFQAGDDSANALLEYAVGPVGVEHVIVAGHTGCGGCIAAHASPLPTETSSSPLMRFLDPVIRLRHSLGERADVDELIVANVKRNVQNVINSPAMKDAWARAAKGERPPVHIHGWLYNLSTGQLEDLDVSVGAKA
ncbi:hypothetical protein EHS25_002591 [Saitozyma podzolica]|uniref:Carbonic anhydrase n=1 Tax=Saitozyma podzolica TaxID=1890683 RepID=A0A427YCN0_9TREE|nr:hypothetical protein EHS25_002591 [Saitozyma podzolica]